MSGGEYLAAAYAVVFAVVLGYVAIIAAKLQRLQRETRKLLELARAQPGEERRSAVYAGGVSEATASEEPPSA
ncbi:MAG TPA: CcmD family protein [Gaiellaceae bacterium]|nr:CcmD family protein [Gaiellaceae bacterium]